MGRAPGMGRMRRAARRLTGRGGEGGQGLVEFALVLPLLLVILFAIVDFGRLYQGQVTLTHAVREGARLGAVGGSTTQVAARVQATAGGLDPAVSVSLPAAAGGSVVVAADAQVELITPLGALINTVFGGSMGTSFDLSATADMHRE